MRLDTLRLGGRGFESRSLCYSSDQLNQEGAVGILQAAGAPCRGQKPAEQEDGSPWACSLLLADLLMQAPS